MEKSLALTLEFYLTLRRMWYIVKTLKHMREYDSCTFSFRDMRYYILYTIKERASVKI